MDCEGIRRPVAADIAWARAAHLAGRRVVCWQESRQSLFLLTKVRLLSGTPGDQSENSGATGHAKLASGGRGEPREENGTIVGVSRSPSFGARSFALQVDGPGPD